MVYTIKWHVVNTLALSVTYAYTEKELISIEEENVI